MADVIASEPDDWLPRLRGAPALREVALDQLREFLVRGLSRALPHRYDGCVGVEDITQIALLKILDSLDSFRGQSRFTTWALAIAIRVAMSEMRRKYYRDVPLETVTSAGTFRLELADPTAEEPETIESRATLAALLGRLIAETLSEKQQIAIRASLDELPVEVIAERLQSNRNAVYKLLHDARMKLREGLEAHGVTVDDVMSAV